MNTEGPELGLMRSEVAESNETGNRCERAWQD